MKATIVWASDVLKLLPEIRPDEIELLDRDIARLVHFPEMYPVRERGRFKGCRSFSVGNWTVYYHFRSGGVYIRAVWPARIPTPR